MEHYKNLDIEDLENEVWKVIPGFADYKVSNLGRVKSYKCGKERIKKQNKLPNEYLLTGLSKDGKSNKLLVHKLVALAFKSNPENKPYVNHLNSNRSDNRADNLSRVTQSENMKHSRKKDYKVRELPPIIKVSKEEWKDIKGYEGIYKINNYGEIKNQKGKLLKPRIQNGYLRIGLSKNKKRYNLRVHRLVAENFLEPSTLPVVNHLDENKLNNYYKNLKWTTQRDNVKFSLDNRNKM